uniref:GTP-binding nuclear protein GSP1/Ran-like n=1 Tax=Hirondellea gigas TaxID=1518452 RepID=A0A2P2I814_9CRUS
MSSNNRAVKIVLVGDGSTGKSSYVARICREGFHNDYIATLGYEKTEVMVNTTDGEFTITVWDTAGQEKAGSLRDEYYEGAHGAVLFFDVTSKTTYKNIPVWHRDLMRVCGDSLPVVLFANKVDVKERKVKSKSIIYHQKYPKSMALVEGSVKDRIHLKEPMEYVLRSITNNSELSICASLEASLFAAFDAIDIMKEDSDTQK